MEELPPISEELKKLYRASIYRVFRPAFDLKIGQKHPAFDEFLIDNNVYSWTFVSAYNPYSTPTNQAENERTHRALQAFCDAQNWRYCEGEGGSVSQDWEAEKSLLILDVSIEKAKALGREFRQNAILFGKLNQVAELIFLR